VSFILEILWIDVCKIFEDVSTFSLDLYQKKNLGKKITLFSNYVPIHYRCTNPRIDGLNQITNFFQSFDILDFLIRKIATKFFDFP
jgi:hypothetical protein